MKFNGLFSQNSKPKDKMSEMEQGKLLKGKQASTACQVKGLVSAEFIMKTWGSHPKYVQIIHSLNKQLKVLQWHSLN